MAKSSRRRKSRDSWGSITEVDRGKRYRIRWWGKDSEGNYRRMTCTVRGTKLDAEKKRSELMLEHSDEAPCPTIGEAWERWTLPAYERRAADGDMAPQSLTQYRSNWDTHVSGRWSGVQCDSVKPLDVQQWIDGLAYGSAERALTVLRPTLDYAVRYGVVPSNPFRERYVMPSKSTVERRDKGVYTYSELGKIWHELAWGKWWESAFIVLAFGGLRVGESIGVNESDVGEMVVDGMPVTTVRVVQQIPNRGKKPTDRLKNPQSRRIVGIPGRAGRRLKDLVGTTGGWLSGDGLGGPSTQCRLTSAWSRALADADGVETHPLRNLRNSFETNTRWVLGVPPWILEPLMGHKGKGITGAYYDRPNDEMLVSAFVRAYLEKPYDVAWDWCEK